MPERMRSILAKVERAEEHISDLNIECRRFLESNGYQTVAYDDPQTSDRVIKFRIVENPPEQISLILGDAIHNLRASLDHLACELVESNGGTITEQTSFPIFPRANREMFEIQI